jgi:hypothetical protein
MIVLPVTKKRRDRPCPKKEPIQPTPASGCPQRISANETAYPKRDEGNISTGISVKSTKAGIEAAVLIIAISVTHIWKERYASESSFRKKHPTHTAMVAANRTEILTTVWPLPSNIGRGVNPKSKSAKKTIEKSSRPGRTRIVDRSILKSVHDIGDEGSSPLHWNLD